LFVFARVVELMATPGDNFSTFLNGDSFFSAHDEPAASSTVLSTISSAPMPTQPIGSYHFPIYTSMHYPACQVSHGGVRQDACDLTGPTFNRIKQEPESDVESDVEPERPPAPRSQDLDHESDTDEGSDIEQEFMANQLFHVAAITDRRFLDQHVKVAWVGYPHTDDSYEPPSMFDNGNCSRALAIFNCICHHPDFDMSILRTESAQLHFAAQHGIPIYL
jgi:hypothetical protein